MTILAIETSHDDTSVSLYENKKIIREITLTQSSFHAKYGGTVPEYASRLHLDNLGKILETFLKEENLEDIDHIAYTYKPGLVGCLKVGKTFAEALGFALNKKVKEINHMHGHIFACAFENEIAYPAIALIVSGGHTQLWKVNSPNDLEIIGQTKDDAAGEAFDKVAKFLNIGFPGGPAIEKLAYESENPYNFNLVDDKTFDFSFSGLKTKIKNFINTKQQKNEPFSKADVARGFQDAIIYNLIAKTERAIKDFNPKCVILGGGVSANEPLRTVFNALDIKTLIPSKKYTTDNASMIAIASDIQNAK